MWATTRQVLRSQRIVYFSSKRKKSHVADSSDVNDEPDWPAALASTASQSVVCSLQRGDGQSARERVTNARNTDRYPHCARSEANRQKR